MDGATLSTDDMNLATADIVTIDDSRCSNASFTTKSECLVYTVSTNSYGGTSCADASVKWLVMRMVRVRGIR